MKIDWKKISKSKGYKSLKAAYVRDVQDSQKERRKNMRPLRNKEQFRKHFKRAIGLAMKYSIQWDIPIDHVLNNWESKRKPTWWLNFYQEHNLSRLKPSL